MKEWDVASYQRKFLTTIAVLKNNKTNQYKEGLVSEIGVDKAVVYDNNHEAFVDLPLKDWEFQYHHVPCGYFSTTGVLFRRTAKRYSVGICPTNYYLGQWNRREDERAFAYYSTIENKPWLTIQPTQCPKRIWTLAEKQMAVNDYGAISPKLFLSPAGIYYLTTRIGSRKNKKDFELFPKYRTVQQELYDSLKEIL